MTTLRTRHVSLRTIVALAATALDADHLKLTPAQMLSDAFIAERRSHIDLKKAQTQVEPGPERVGGETSHDIQIAPFSDFGPSQAIMKLTKGWLRVRIQERMGTQQETRTSREAPENS